MKAIIEDAILKNYIAYIPAQLNDLPGWDTFHKLFLLAEEKNGITARTFGTFGVDRAESYLESFDNLINYANANHPLKAVSALAIVHFLSANDNTIKPEVEEIYSSFLKTSTESPPPNFQQYMVPLRHSDPVDGIYVQCTGTALWTAYYEKTSEKFTVYPGDIMFIPKGIEHTVETLEPRAAISIGMV